MFRIKTQQRVHSAHTYKQTETGLDVFDYVAKKIDQTETAVLQTLYLWVSGSYATQAGHSVLLRSFSRFFLFFIFFCRLIFEINETRSLDDLVIRNPKRCHMFDGDS